MLGVVQAPDKLQMLPVLVFMVYFLYASDVKFHLSVSVQEREG